MGRGFAVGRRKAGARPGGAGDAHVGRRPPLDEPAEQHARLGRGGGDRRPVAREQARANRRRSSARSGAPRPPNSRPRLRSDGSSPSTQPATTTVCHSRPAAARIDVTVTASAAVPAAASTRHGSAATPSSSRTASRSARRWPGLRSDSRRRASRKATSPSSDGVVRVSGLDEVPQRLLPHLEGQLGGGGDVGLADQMVAEGDEGSQAGIVDEGRPVRPGPQPQPPGLHPVEVGQGRHQQPVEGRLVAVDPPEHVDDAADHRVVGHRRHRGPGRRPGGDAVAGEGAGDGGGPVAGPAHEDGHVATRPPRRRGRPAARPPPPPARSTGGGW